MRKFVLATVIALSYLSGSAEAGFYDGNEVYARCTSAEANRETWCLGYVAGVADTYQTHLKVLSNGRRCFPKGSTLGQLKDVFIRYLLDHPEDRHWDADGLAMLSFRDAFCPDKK
ncbi:hypothetical protein GF108_01245 [Phyllobacterium sp. SYP-B3895]|uniref:Rap1a/Tai family immunity protein n=1 Tax=Phyllobacterium sp. SYP-B3895 TaxID=2663240 RepID=UPI001299BD09|nr:Rap1a/Tai family immunity protein [Phyllobacterium sp. SYP-B3895]MRG54208.1 hypothetical protein [Phyllobacterium sp. SYP-B3895]